MALVIIYTYVHFLIYVVLPCALDNAWAMDRTAPVYIAQGDLQKARILMQRAAQRKNGSGASLVTKDAQNLLFFTGMLAVMQGRFEEGRKILVEIVSGENQTHLRGTYIPW